MPVRCPCHLFLVTCPVLLCLYRTAQVEGEVRYNGKAFNEFVVERTAAYIDQMRESWVEGWEKSGIGRNR